jgi:hypothetical protein
MTMRAIYRLTRTPEAEALMKSARSAARHRKVRDLSDAALLRSGLQAFVDQWAHKPPPKAPPVVVAPPAAPTPGAERLKRARELAGLSMGAVARACGLEGHSRVSQIERGLQPLTGRVLEWVEEQGRAGEGAS